MSIKRVSGKFEFSRNRKDFEQFKRTAPKIIANNSLNHFLQGFRQGGGKTDAGRWQPRKPSTRRNEGRSLLVDTGALRRDVQVLKAFWNQIVLGTRNIPYAIRHNEGTADRLGRKMPKREYIGESKELNKNNVNLLEKMLNKVMNI
jgi:hypothetical protein